MRYDGRERERPGRGHDASTVDYGHSHFAGLDIVSLGPVGHHATEDAPDAVGRAIATWMDRRGL